MTRAANQKKIVTAANKVRTSTHTQHMMNLHLLLRKTTTADCTTTTLNTIQRTPVTQHTVANIPPKVIRTAATLHTVSGNVNTNPPNLPFLQKIHNTTLL